jgi:hypothetical protein
MRSRVGLLSLLGLLGLIATADAQTPTNTAFDGTYRVVSTAKVNQTYLSKAGRALPCVDRTPGPLTIVNGHAKYTTETGIELVGAVAPNGELDLQPMDPHAGAGLGRPFGLRMKAAIDSTGTVHARQTGFSCSYDFVWRKQ